jgi:hypothetical protein
MNACEIEDLEQTLDWNNRTRARFDIERVDTERGSHLDILGEQTIRLRLECLPDKTAAVSSSSRAHSTS